MLRGGSRTSTRVLGDPGGEGGGPCRAFDHSQKFAREVASVSTPADQERRAQGNRKLADMHLRRSRRCKGGPTRYLWLSGESG